MKRAVGAGRSIGGRLAEMLELAQMNLSVLVDQRGDDVYLIQQHLYDRQIGDSRFTLIARKSDKDISPVHSFCLQLCPDDLPAVD